MAVWLSSLTAIRISPAVSFANIFGNESGKLQLEFVDQFITAFIEMHLKLGRLKGFK
jgi:hypothetical protein